MSADVVIIGAGIVGASCAYFAARAGLRTIVLDRAGIAGGTSSAGEGNLLVSDKAPGPELDLARYAQRLWRDDLAAHRSLWEYEDKGGVVVAGSEPALTALRRFAAAQRRAGVRVDDLGPDRLPDLEPELAHGLAGGAYYPDDAQVQPMLATAHLLRLARGFGAEVRLGDAVTGFVRSGDRVTGVRVTGDHDVGEIAAGAVINAAGTWAGDVAARAGVVVPVLPRRGFILVTEPVGPLIRHKVYAADYVANVASPDAALQTSPVIEGTPSGTILIGSSRERVGFDHSVPPSVLGTLAGQAIELFPVLAGVRALRHYHGFRPYCPDHLPVIGADPRAPGLLHGCGHEGAGIGLSVATGALLSQVITGAEPDLDLSPFRPERFLDHDDPARSGAPDGSDPAGQRRRVPVPSRTTGHPDDDRARSAVKGDDHSPATSSIMIKVDGRTLPAEPGRSVASVLIAAGITSWRTTRKNDRPRGVFCGIGACFDCLVRIDDEPPVRGCLVPVRPGMIIRTAPAAVRS